MEGCKPPFDERGLTFYQLLWDEACASSHPAFVNKQTARAPSSQNGSQPAHRPGQQLRRAGAAVDAGGKDDRRLRAAVLWRQHAQGGRRRGGGRAPVAGDGGGAAHARGGPAAGGGEPREELQARKCRVSIALRGGGGGSRARVFGQEHLRPRAPLPGWRAPSAGRAQQKLRGATHTRRRLLNHDAARTTLPDEQARDAAAARAAGPPKGQLPAPLCSASHHRVAPCRPSKRSAPCWRSTVSGRKPAPRRRRSRGARAARAAAWNLEIRMGPDLNLPPRGRTRSSLQLLDELALEAADEAAPEEADGPDGADRAPDSPSKRADVASLEMLPSVMDRLAEATGRLSVDRPERSWVPMSQSPPSADGPPRRSLEVMRRLSARRPAPRRPPPSSAHVAPGAPRLSAPPPHRTRLEPRAS